MTNAPEVSVVDSPLFADDDRRELPALYHQDLQGGNSKSKHSNEDEIVYQDCTEFSTFLPEVIDRARGNFAKFWNMPVEAVDEETIMKKSPSLGVAGWPDPYLEIRDYGLIASERRMREQQERSLSGHIVDDEGTEDQNVQVIRLIAALGNKDSGRRAILSAMAAKQGVSSEQDIDDLMNGTSARRLQVPAYLRNVLSDIGLSDAIAPLNLFEVVGGAEPLLLAGDTWKDFQFEVALGSGVVVHVCSPEDCPGYLREDSPGSRSGQRFLMGDGGTIVKIGQKSLNPSDDGNDLGSVFQIAAVTRPLMSVGKICDEGHNITFDANQAVVRDKGGVELRKFHRTPGGLYVAKMRLRNPAVFARPE